MDDMLRTIAVARLILGPQMNIQAPPNLSYSDFPRLLDAGINDWGGISPVTKDLINPEAAWPQIAKLEAETERARFHSSRTPCALSRIPRPRFLLCRPPFDLTSSVFAARRARAFSAKDGFLS